MSAAGAGQEAGAPAPEMDAADNLEIEGEAVVRLIMQFLREQGLSRALAALQDETGVSLNVVEDGDALQADILGGKWERVLASIAGFSLPNTLQAMVYEQIIFELCEARELDLSKTLLRTTLPLLMLKREDPSRYARLEHLVAKPSWDPKDAYGTLTAAADSTSGPASKDTRRRDIARAISSHLWTAPPSRLMTLLGQALKWQKQHGVLPADISNNSGAGKFDLFRGCVPLRKDVEEKPCVVSVASVAAMGLSSAATAAPEIKFGATAYPLACDFSPDGSSLVAGCVDGIVELYGGDSGKLRMDIPYQASDDFMLHNDAVLCLAVSKPDGELLATGSRDGQVKVWRLSTGECLRKFTSPHGAGDAAVSSSSSSGAAATSSASSGAGSSSAAGVTALAFSRDCSQLITGGFDGAIKVHGLRSGKTLKEYRGHTGTITSIAVANGDGAVVSSSADGSVRVWDPKSTECLAVIKLPQSSATGDAAILSVTVIPRSPDHLLILPRGGTAYITTSRGAALKTITSPTGAAAFVCATVSPQGRYIYAVAEDKHLHVFSTRTGLLEATMEGAGGGGTLGLAHHPLRNLLASYGSDGVLRFWQPALPAFAQ